MINDSNYLAIYIPVNYSEDRTFGINCQYYFTNQELDQETQTEGQTDKQRDNGLF